MPKFWELAAKDIYPILRSRIELGHRMQRTDEDLPRYEVNGKLMDDEWSVLAEANVR